jgi:protein phosphatase
MSLRITVGFATDVGHVRDGNEDGYLAKGPLYAVADGMGGRRAGEVASAMALETVAKKRKKGIVEAAQEANAVVFKKQERDPSTSGMGTTLTALVVDDDAMRFAHVGDSRAYRLRDGELSQLTTDHTLVNEWVESGQITAEQALSHPQRSMLTRAIGTQPTIEVDEFHLHPDAGDRILLCTDGLTGMIVDDGIRDILAGHAGDPQAAADALVEAANAAGGYDNVTVVVLDIDKDESDTPAPASSPAAAPQRRRLFGGAANNAPGAQDIP